MVQWIRPILQKLVFEVSHDKTLIYEESQPTIDVIKTNHPKIIVKHIAVPIHYVHEQYVLLTIYTVKLKTNIQPADIGTKSSTGPLFKKHSSYIRGARYYPPPDSDQYIRLELDTLITPYLSMDPTKYLKKLT